VQFPTDLTETIRIHLEEDKKKIVSQIVSLSDQDPFADPDRTIDNAASDTEASEEFNHDRMAALIEELKMKLTELDDALLRIGNGTYGFCAMCEAMIDTDRLSVLSTAKYCSACEIKKKTTTRR
jgi:DnaK suppressor protein